MTLQTLLDKAAALHAEIKTLAEEQKRKQAELDALKLEIAEKAAKMPETKKTDGGGKSWELASRSGVAVRVTQPAPRLLSSMTGKIVDELKALCGRRFGKLFLAKFSCVPNFRTAAYEQLPDKETAEKVIALVEQKSAATVVIGEKLKG